MATQTETLQITGMSCGHCVRGVREALERVEGVEIDSVEIGSARVRYDETKASHEQIVQAVEEEGYGVVS